MEIADKRKSSFTAWPVDGMEKIFSDARPPRKIPKLIELAAAAGECEVAQVAVHSPKEDICLYKPKISSLRFGGNEIPGENISSRFVELVPVRFQSQGIPREELVRVPPAYFPDPLCLEDTMIVPAGQTRSVWLCFKIPEGTKAGRYRSSVKVLTSAGEELINVELTVWPFCLPKNIPFSLTLWIWPALLAKYHCVKLYSDDFWELLERYAADMEAHRQNVIFTPIFGAESLVGIIRTKDKQYRFDFTMFDRWVEIFFRYNFQTIEGSHIFDPSVKFARVLDEESEKEVMVEVQGTKNRIVPDEEYVKIVAGLFRALRGHIENKGWTKRYIQHIFDEPSKQQVPSYLFLANLVHDIWPEVLLVDAAGDGDADSGLLAAMDILVPLVDSRVVYQKVKERKQTGKILWGYTCNHPRGKYPGVFLDQPLIKTRIIPWIMWRYGITGYLYYALGYWAHQHELVRYGFDPYTGRKANEDTLYNPWLDPAQNATWQVPPGSWGFVYPPRDPVSQDPDILAPHLVENFNRVRNGFPSNKEHEGPSNERAKVLRGIVDSIRWEQLREGVEDYGILCRLKEEIEKAGRKPERKKAADRAKKTLDKTVKQVALNWTHYAKDPAGINKARRRIAEEIIKLQRKTGKHV